MQPLIPGLVDDVVAFIISDQVWDVSNIRSLLYISKKWLVTVLTKITKVSAEKWCCCDDFIRFSSLTSLTGLIHWKRPKHEPLIRWTAPRKKDTVIKYTNIESLNKYMHEKVKAVSEAEIKRIKDWVSDISRGSVTRSFKNLQLEVQSENLDELVKKVNISPGGKIVIKFGWITFKVSGTRIKIAGNIHQEYVARVNKLLASYNWDHVTEISLDDCHAYHKIHSHLLPNVRTLVTDTSYPFGVAEFGNITNLVIDAYQIPSIEGPTRGIIKLNVSGRFHEWHAHGKKFIDMFPDLIELTFDEYSMSGERHGWCVTGIRVVNIFDDIAIDNGPDAGSFRLPHLNSMIRNIIEDGIIGVVTITVVVRFGRVKRTITTRLDRESTAENSLIVVNENMFK